MSRGYAWSYFFFGRALFVLIRLLLLWRLDVELLLSAFESCVDLASQQLRSERRLVLCAGSLSLVRRGVVASSSRIAPNVTRSTRAPSKTYRRRLSVVLWDRPVRDPPGTAPETARNGPGPPGAPNGSQQKKKETERPPCSRTPTTIACDVACTIAYCDAMQMTHVDACVCLQLPSVTGSCMCKA